MNKLNSGIKNDTQVTLKLLSNVIGDSNGQTNFPHKFLWANTVKLLQVVHLLIWIYQKLSFLK